MNVPVPDCQDGPTLKSDPRAPAAGGRTGQRATSPDFQGGRRRGVQGTSLTAFSKRKVGTWIPGPQPPPFQPFQVWLCFPQGWLCCSTAHKRNGSLRFENNLMDFYFGAIECARDSGPFAAHHWCLARHSGTVTGCSRSERAAIFEPRHAPVDPGKLPFLQLLQGNGAIVRTALLVVCSRQCHAAAAGTRDDLEVGRLPTPACPSTPRPQHQPQDPSQFANDPWALGPFSTGQRTRGHPSSNFQGPTSARSFQLLTSQPASILLLLCPERSVASQLCAVVFCLHTAKRLGREAFGCRRLAVVSNRA